jgi:hypothetical protein
MTSKSGRIISVLRAFRQERGTPEKSLGASRYASTPAMDRPPMPLFWIAVQILIIICVLISAVIVIVKL